MLIFNNFILKHFRLDKLFFKTIRPYYVDDRYFNYFRKNDVYKNCVIQLNNDIKENKLVSPGVSFLITEKDAHTGTDFTHLLVKENVMKLPKLQLKDSMYIMASTKIDVEKYKNALTYMDEKCAVSVDRWNLDFCLYILDAWLIILGKNAFRKHYWCALTHLLNKKMKKCSKYNLIFTLYLIGLSKKSPPFLMELIEHKMESFVSELTDEELAIACLSFFKTSTKIGSNLLLQQCSKAAENLVYKNDRFNLINILKCFRLSQYSDLNLITIINNYIKKEYASFNFVECTNFLAFFATKNIYNFETYKCLEYHGIDLLSKENTEIVFNKTLINMHPSERIRVKDLARFLWGMTFVGHNIDRESVNFIIDQLNIRMNSTEFETNLPALIDCLQSLVILGCYCKNILEYVLNPSFLQKVSNFEKAKPKYQLFFISRSAYVENFVCDIQTMKFINNIPKSLQNDISQREGFQELINYLNMYLGQSSFICCFIMPHIMISGIIVASYPKKDDTDKLITSEISKLIEIEIISKSVQDILDKDKIYTCIELLDQSVCVHESDKPLGLMKAKIRQLQNLNFDVITLTPEEIRTLVRSNEQDKCTKLHNLIC